VKVLDFGLAKANGTAHKYLVTIVVDTTMISAVAGVVAKQLKQKRAFASLEQEVFLALRIATARLLEPWGAFLKTTVGLTNSQYNALRILRGSHPTRLTCSDIGQRMIARDPDVTRVVDRLTARGLVERTRSSRDRRVVEVGITETGLALLHDLDVHALRMPRALLGHLGPTRLRHLRALLEAVIADMGTFP
jgi:DNA-binding MarR family transcriptional regulator